MRRGFRRLLRLNPDWRHPWRFLSPLTGRILAVNVLAPLLLLVGLLYVDQYERTLVQTEIDSLTSYASLLAAALGEGAVTAEVEAGPKVKIPLTSHHLERDQARSMVRRLAQLGGVRTRLFDPGGPLLADSRRLVGPGGAIQVFDLPPLESSVIGAVGRAIYGQIKRWTGSFVSLPLYTERGNQTASDYEEVVTAIDSGNPTSRIRQLDQQPRQDQAGRVLSVAVPVQYYKQIVGAVMVSKSDADLTRSLFDIRWQILRLFFITLAVTTLMSLYLARTIARPVRLLAAAAEQAGGDRQPLGRGIEIPDLSRRGDEIGDLSLSLRAMTAALWARMDAIERFAADVSHEIKNPLTSLRSALETLSRVHDPDKQARLMAILHDDVSRMDRLISDISDASRLDAELSRAVMTPVAVGALLGALADTYGPSGEERGVRLVVTVPEHDPLFIMAMEARLVQVLRNLIGNALSFSPLGGTIQLSGERAGGQVVVVVDDDGPGIPAGKEQAIFERFYSERPEGEKFGTHSGLGLSISKHIIEAHGGSITASVRHDEAGAVLGARFVIHLPPLLTEAGQHYGR